MKPVCLVILLCVISSTFLAASPIKGTASEKWNGHKIFLRYYGKTQYVLDSCVIRNGRFAFSTEETDTVKAELFAIVKNSEGVLGYDRRWLLLDRKPVSLKITHHVRDAAVSGSKINADYDVYRNYVNAPVILLDSINNVRIRTNPDGSIDKEHQQAFFEARMNASKEMARLQKEFMETYPDSYASLECFNALYGGKKDLVFLKEVFQKLSPALQSSTQGRKISEKMKVL